MTLTSSPTTRLRRLALAVAAALLTPVAAASASTTPGPVEWTVSPADSEGPDDRISLRHTIDAGGSASDAIAVTNLGSEAAIFDVSAGDGVVGPTGAFDITAEDPVGSGSWVQVEGLTDGAVEVAAGDTAVLPVTISVPQEATPGEHPAGIVVGVSDSSGGTTLTHRIGVRLHLQVAGELAPGIQISDLTTTVETSWIPFAPATLTVDYVVHNTGNTRIGSSGQLDATGPLGIGAGAETDVVEEILPGTSMQRSVTTTAWPLFWVDTEVELSPVAVAEDRLALPPPVVASTGTFAISWTGLATLALALALAVWFLRRRRRRLRAASNTADSSRRSDRELVSATEG